MVEVRVAQSRDIEAIIELQHVCYPLLSTVALWRRPHLENHQAKFPDGQLVALHEGEIIGFSASFVVSSRRWFRPHTFREVTTLGTFDAHDPTGDTLYGAEIMVDPAHRRKGIARRFYQARFDLVRRLGLHFFAAGGRVPGYARVKGDVPIDRYVDEVVRGDRVDRVLTPQLRAGLRVLMVLPEYLEDPNSENYATLLVWENPDLAIEPRRPARRARRA